MATFAQVVQVYVTCRAVLADADLPEGVPYCAERPGGELWLGWRFDRVSVAVDEKVSVALRRQVGEYIDAVSALPGRIEMRPRREWVTGPCEEVPPTKPVSVVDVPMGEPWDVLRERALVDAGVSAQVQCGPVLAPSSLGQDTLLTRLTLLSVPPRKAVKLTEGWDVRNSTSRGFRILLAFSAAVKVASRGMGEEGGDGFHCESSAFHALRVFVSTTRSLSVGDPSFCVRSMMSCADEFLQKTGPSCGVGQRVSGALFEASKAMKLVLPHQV